MKEIKLKMAFLSTYTFYLKKIVSQEQTKKKILFVTENAKKAPAPYFLQWGGKWGVGLHRPSGPAYNKK